MGDGFEGNIPPIDEWLGLIMTKYECVSTILIIVCEACSFILRRSRTVGGLLEAKSLAFVSAQARKVAGRSSMQFTRLK